MAGCLGRTGKRTPRSVMPSFERAQARGLSPVEPSRFEALAGHGAIAQVGEHQIVLGNLKMMSEQNVDLNGLGIEATRLQAHQKSVIWVAIDGKAAGLIAVADTIKPGSQEAIDQMHRLGLQVMMITGDNRANGGKYWQCLSELIGSSPKSCREIRQQQ